MKRTLLAPLSVVTLTSVALATPKLAQAQDADRHISVTMEHADVRFALKQIFSSVGYNYVLDPAVKGTITTSLKEVPFRAALTSVLRNVEQGPALTFRVEEGIYNIVPAAAVEAGGRIVTVKMQVNYVSAESMVRELKRQSPLRETTTFTYSAVQQENAVVASGTEDDIRLLKEGIRLLDVQQRQIMLKAELILVVDGKASKEKGRVIWSPTIRTFSNQDSEIRTEVKDGGTTTWRSGFNRLKIRPRLNGDNTITMDADWTADMQLQIDGQAVPIHLSHSASGAVRCATGETVALAGAILKLGGKPIDGELLLFLTPTIVPDRPADDRSR
jgi:type II secretory pathway component GspD/PulD (secretin)